MANLYSCDMRVDQQQRMNPSSFISIRYISVEQGAVSRIAITDRCLGSFFFCCLAGQRLLVASGLLLIAVTPKTQGKRDKGCLTISPVKSRWKIKHLSRLLYTSLGPKPHLGQTYNVHNVGLARPLLVATRTFAMLFPWYLFYLWLWENEQTRTLKKHLTRKEESKEKLGRRSLENCWLLELMMTYARMKVKRAILLIELPIKITVLSAANSITTWHGKLNFLNLLVLLMKCCQTAPQKISCLSSELCTQASDKFSFWSNRTRYLFFNNIKCCYVMLF